MPAKTYPHYDLNERVSDGISLRWHYPNQVPGLGDAARSQPTRASSPVDSSHHSTFRRRLQHFFIESVPKGPGFPRTLSLAKNFAKLSPIFKTF